MTALRTGKSKDTAKKKGKTTVTYTGNNLYRQRITRETKTLCHKKCRVESEFMVIGWSSG